MALKVCMRKSQKNVLPESGFNDPEQFWPSKNFLKVKEQIDNSEVFKIIRKMPKGGLLHVHSTALGSYNFFRDNVLNQDYLYVCEQNGTMKFLFTRSPDELKCDWTSMKEFGRTKDDLDSELRDRVVFQASNPKVVSNNINVVWQQFVEKFSARGKLIKYKPIYEKYLYQALQDLYDDNIMFAEIRMAMSHLYDLDGNFYPVSEISEVYANIINKFRETHPNFLGATAILTAHRKITPEKLAERLKTFKLLKKQYPDFVRGFDLVDQEDVGEPLKTFVDQFLELKKEIPFFFHAGETNWYDHSSDENLIDAVLLHTKRIGHGYALLKHPKVMDLVKEEKIAIEINPISNQVLRLVDDLRNHPASYFFAKNFPVVISSDDPGLWGAMGLSHDFYEAFVGIMSRNSDLRSLKQLAINSITYSTMRETEKKVAFEMWKRKWDIFVHELANDVNCSKSSV